MLGRLPDLFDRNFAIGFLLPVVIFALANYVLMESFALPNILDPLFAGQDTLANTTIHIIGIVLCAVLLMALNWHLYRLLEGYGLYNPIRFIRRRELNRYNALVQRQDELEGQWSKLADRRPDSEASQEVSEATRSRSRELEIAEEQQRIQSSYNTVTKILAEEFPDEEKHVLPTRFGNRIRAFEIYSRERYGFEIIGGWERLADVIPNEYRSRIDEAKAITDFWLNLGILGFLSLVAYIGIAIHSYIYYATVRIGTFWFPLTAFVITMLAVRAARTAAGHWGETVKAAVDIFLPELATRIGLPTDEPQERNKELWKLFSQSINYRSNEAVRRLEEILRNQHEDREGLSEKLEQASKPQGWSEDDGQSKS